MTVIECARQSSKSKIWLCPNIIVGGNVKLPMMFSGYDCTKTSIPAKLRDRNVVKTFNDAGACCIIWENVPYRENRYCYEEDFSAQFKKVKSEEVEDEISTLITDRPN